MNIQKESKTERAHYATEISPGHCYIVPCGMTKSAKATGHRRASK
jgi:hypothetical protein